MTTKVQMIAEVDDLKVAGYPLPVNKGEIFSTWPREAQLFANKKYASYVTDPADTVDQTAVLLGVTEYTARIISDTYHLGLVMGVYDAPEA